MKDMLMVVLSDSLMYAPRNGVHHNRLWDSTESFQVCKCSFFGGTLLGTQLKGKHYRSGHLLSMGTQVMEGEMPSVAKYLAPDPQVRVVVVKGERSIAACRKPGKEVFPNLVSDRRRSRVISSLETEWSILDLEDVVQQRKGRRRFKELEPCKLRDERGLYGTKDPWHFRPDIFKSGTEELLKAIRRTAVARHGNSIKDGGVVLVLAVGWNAEDDSYGSLDRFGKAWRRAELLGLAELCALDGRPVSAFKRKIQQLSRWRRGCHRNLLKKSVNDVKYEPAPPRQVGRKQPRESESALFSSSKRRKI